MEKLYFTPERRRANVNLITDKLNEVKGLDFNDLVFAFADIIHASFVNGLFIGKSKEEREAINNEILQINHAVVDALNNNGSNMMNDMVVLSSLIMDAVESAMQRAIEDSKQV